ncbi:hypothetical protein KKC1_14100, partial [Calderihabitans maritimus]
MFKLPFEVVN